MAAAIVLAAPSAGMAQGPGASAGVPAPTGAEDYLLYPSLELRWAGPVPDAIRIGQKLHFRMEGKEAPKPDASAVEVESAPGAPPLIETGWYVEPLADPSGGGVLLRVIPLSGGHKKLPTLIVRDGDGDPVRTLPLEIQVEAPDAPQEAARQEPPPEYFGPAGLSYPLWLIVAAGVLGALILATALYFMIHALRARRGAGVTDEPAPPEKSPEERAVEQLERLRAARLWRQGRLKEHYFGVSEALKLYLGGRYGFDAPESTSREIVETLEDKNVNARTVDRVESLYERLDRVKFTDYVPHEEEGGELLEEAVKIIHDTKRVPAAPETRGVAT